VERVDGDPLQLGDVRHHADDGVADHVVAFLGHQVTDGRQFSGDALFDEGP